MIRRVFWGWDQPVLSQAVTLLTRDWQGGELDLSGTLLVVPTTESARRLKEALARATAQKGGAAVVPHVWAPEQALLAPQDRAQIAPRLASVFAWARVLSDIDFTAFPRLFPQPPESADSGWCLATAQMLMDLSATLGAGGWTCAGLATAEQTKGDRDRWQELALLEHGYWGALDAQNLVDGQRLKAARAADPWLPEGIHRVLVLAAPDLPPLLSTWAAAVAGRCEVMVCVQAPADLAHAFDPEGRPAIDFWQRPAALSAPVETTQVHLAPNAARQADLLIRQVADLALGSRTAVGVCDPEVMAALKERLSLEEVRVFEPGGVPPQSQGLWHVFACWRDLLATRSWRSLASLLRVEEVAKALVGKGETAGARLLMAADELAMEQMPVTLDHALELLQPGDDPAKNGLSKALLTARKWLDGFERMPLDEAVRAFLIELYGEREFTPSAPEHRLHLELAETVLEAAAEVHLESGRFAFRPGAAETLALVLDQVGESMLTEPRGEVDLVLQGWLELLWEEAPCVVVAGMNEEHVPGILVSHPFLPDSLRQTLGLPSQASRYARDAYLLHALAAQRQGAGLQLLCGQWSERGDALRPSRLLFRGSDQGLPARVARLFPKDEDHAVIAEPPASMAWKLVPDLQPVTLTSISASRLTSYLTCPFRFYLGSVQHMESVDPAKREMAASEFGDLVHHAFQQLGLDKAMAASTKEKEIADFLCTAAEARALKLYGGHLPVLVRLQLESALQRLRAAAAYEAASRMDGWRISETETPLKDLLRIEEVPFVGTIDRVEVRERGGRAEVRLIDFKSSDKPLSPLLAHVREITGRSRIQEEDEWKRFDMPGAGRGQWLNLQLPLYAAAMAARGVSDVQVAYFNLPKSVQDTAIIAWPDFNHAWVDAALQCAGEIVRRIQAGVFWPPVRVPFDDYSELFLGDVASSVQPPGGFPAAGEYSLEG